MSRFIGVLLTALLVAGSAAAYEINLVYKEVLPGVSNPQMVIDSNGGFRGVLYFCGPNYDLVYYRFGEAAPDTIPVPGDWPKAFVSRMDGDTLNVYAVSKTIADVYGSTPLITRVKFVNGEVARDTMRQYDISAEGEHYFWERYVMGVTIDTTGLDGGGVIVGNETHWVWWEMTMGTTEWITDASTWYSWDLSDIHLTTRGLITIPANFPDTAAVPYVAYRHEYYSIVDDPWNSYMNSYSAIWIDNRWGKALSWEEPSLLIVGDFASQYPGDEFIHRGRNVDLAGVRIDSVPYQSCYALADAGLTEVWCDTVLEVYPMRYIPAMQKIVGIVTHANNTVVGLVDPATGETTMRLDLRRKVGMQSFFMAGPDHATLGMVGRWGDTTFIYQFDTPTDVTEPSPDLPASFTLDQNYPNPFNAGTTISFSLAWRSPVRAIVYNLLGQEVAILADRDFPAGTHRLQWNGADEGGHSVASGMYLFRLTAGEFSRSIRMVLLK